MFASVIITAAASKKIQGGYPWVFERDFLSRRHPRAGIVAVHDRRGRFIGQAFYSPLSKIVLRFITPSKKEIDGPFWRTLIKKGYERRKNLEGTSNAFRVVNAEGDFIPSIIIDKYNDIWSVQITSAGAETQKEGIVSSILEGFQPASIIEKNNIEVRRQEGLPLFEKILHGNKIMTTIREGARSFTVNVLQGQKTGAYLDYRAIRLQAATLCKGNALDLFCYEGWLCCHIAPRATRVTAVDSSPEAIQRARSNAGSLPIDFIEGDVFDFLEECKESYDFIHLDPPSFAKGKRNRATAIKGYEKINTLALKLLNPRGILLTSSCSHSISEGIFENTIKRCCERLGRRYKILYRGLQDRDHPVLRGLPESLYLKAIGIELDH